MPTKFGDVEDGVAFVWRNRLFVKAGYLAEQWETFTCPRRIQRNGCSTVLPLDEEVLVLELHPE